MAYKEKYLGTAQEKRRYDLPLNKDAGTGFLTLLIALMALLATLALASSFTLSAMADRWTSGLEGKLTVEIPAQDADGHILNHDDVKALSQRLETLLQSHPSVSATHVMDDDEIMALVKPWLGSGMTLEDAPLPGLITVELKEGSDFNTHAMEERIVSIAPQAHIETHQSWLKDVLKFTDALQFAASALALIIGVTTVTAIAGAIRSRMAVHQEEVSLLHLMGASDNYIARQFQHHTLFLALKGALAGVLTGMFVLWLLGRIAGGIGVAMLPDFHLGIRHLAALACLPFLAALIATFTARRTVFRVLEEMP